MLMPMDSPAGLLPPLLQHQKCRGAMPEKCFGKTLVLFIFPCSLVELPDIH